MVMGTLLTQMIPTFSRSHGPGVTLHPEYVRILESSQQILNENWILTEVAETCFALPAYFRQVQLVRERQQLTPLSMPAPYSPELVGSPRHVAPDQRVLYRKVAAPEIIDVGPPYCAGLQAAAISGRSRWFLELTS
jgi:hypothetical protein